jgi:hypothetical protein
MACATASLRRHRKMTAIKPAMTYIAFDWRVAQSLNLIRLGFEISGGALFAPRAKGADLILASLRFSLISVGFMVN